MLFKQGLSWLGSTYVANFLFYFNFNFLKCPALHVYLFLIFVSSLFVYADWHQQLPSNDIIAFFIFWESRKTNLVIRLEMTVGFFIYLFIFYLGWYLYTRTLSKVIFYGSLSLFLPSPWLIWQNIIFLVNFDTI